MTKEELKAGLECAYEKSHSAEYPLQHIRLIERVQGRWRAEWIDPNPGLIGYAASKQIVARWEDHEDFHRDKVSLAHLTEYNRSLGYMPESPVKLAIEVAFESTGESTSCFKGFLSLPSESLDRIVARIGLAGYELKPPAYTDRMGDVHFPLDQAMQLGQSFCRAEPLTVLMSIEATEREWSDQASRRGEEYEEYIVPTINSYRPAWALLRQWCHNDAFTASREKETSTLVRLLWDAIYALQKAGADDEADRLRHVLERG